MKTFKILIAGGTGLLGTSLAPYLKEQGHQVFTHGLSKNADIKGDLTDLVEVKRIFEEHEFEYVINLAALTNVDICQKEVHKSYLLNTKIVENIVGSMDKSKTKLIHISTDQIYDGTGPHDEDNITISNVYAYSKYAGELAALSANSCILRTNFFGHSQLKTRPSFSDWLIRSFEEQTEIKLFTDVYFSPLNLITLCEQINIVMNKFSKGVFNLGSKEGMSKRDFAHELASYLNYKTDHAKDALSSDCELKAYRPKDMRMDVTKYEETFDVFLPTTMEEIKKLRSEI